MENNYKIEMIRDTRAYWHNYGYSCLLAQLWTTGTTMDTEQNDYRDTPSAAQYIPQIDAAQNMYKLLIGSLGMDHQHACIYVLSAALGIKNEPIE